LSRLVILYENEIENILKMAKTIENNIKKSERIMVLFFLGKIILVGLFVYARFLTVNKWVQKIQMWYEGMS